MLQKNPTKLLIATLALSLFIGCSEENETPSGNIVSANIDGETWQTDKMNIIATQQSGSLYHIKELQALHNNGSKITIAFDQLKLSPQKLSTSFRTKGLQLKSFTANTNGSDVTIQWITLGEYDYNFSHFSVQRSYDNYYWSSVAYTYQKYVPDYEVTYTEKLYGEIPDNQDVTYAYYRLIGYDDYSEVVFTADASIKLRADVYFSDQNGKFAGYNGEITITKYDTGNRLISGNFSFSYRDRDDKEHKVTEGSFTNISY